ncbi:alpha/beta hydrolase [Verminephrobacter aporrectodeae subsp. tuberculatae]|uniref:alpha/beta fold hydrolase n=1 Tax=Verminephrobacter aporrectodeae TaxID=1110389 RepID=UPI0002377AD5|nr:alpha/beta hydrolase [Verminephrobacter aporrectodeae]MCW5255742.1 alpha/beta hydrolase [Verminephrobacter aporrectodeae subsp. tuberculatae]MCW8165332.1 alpha/beta hydrolase [Verminephrobacter aporrectodeae subsp. tuberculatae]MCW8168949.1 alpha/beta hydrolase [Verminephrobacter aporrectodeae subsp. tuberculatae]MCW8199175.1 alpha/beta hydrolase [Verminephrobacter aporrectodeae subsp. tuberculatae]
MYQPRHASRSSTLALRHLNYHVRHWGPQDSPRPALVLLHGWMDVSASYQFTVDALRQERRIIAPDWRGFGGTSSAQADHYFFPDYLADLDLLLDHCAPGQAVDLVGHSMGGNVAMMYAGVRPDRVRRLVNLEGFGLPATQPAQAPARYAQWIDEIRQLHQGAMALKTYDSADGVARRLMRTNPRLARDKAEWLAQHWARPNARGQWEILGDPAHKITSAQLFRVDEVLAMYGRISAPVLAVEADANSLGQWWGGEYTLDEYHQRLRHVRDCRSAVVRDAGHMLHHDQPGQVAQLIEQFLDAA